MGKEQEELLNEVYRKYADSHEYFVDGWLHVIPMEHSKETFTNKCKTDYEFSKQWGLTIEERELIGKERVILYEQKTNIDTSFFPVLRETLNFHNIPTKLITMTYNDKTIESYE
jgi:hypothetical protein